MFNAKERILPIHGGTRCITFGRGHIPLVMIQGLNTRDIKGSGPMLSLMYRQFAREFTVYVFDRRPDVFDGITVRQLAADTAEMMDALGIAQANVLGVSQGGMMAQYLAIDRPNLVGKLALAVTAARVNPTMKAVVENWIELTNREDYQALTRDMAEKLYSEAYLKRYRPLLPLLTLINKPKDKHRFTALARACLTVDTYDELDKIKCPTLVIGGGQDRIVTPEASREIAAKLGCEAVIFEQYGHAAYEEARGFERTVGEFFWGRGDRREEIGDRR